MAIELATFEQIATILTQLGTNYSNLFTDYFNIFYSNEPMDVTLQYYDEAGALQTITIPNRAKDRRYILNGEGAPEGSVSGQAGALYQDLLNGNVYIKQVSASDVNGWEKIISAEDLSEFISKGSGSPEGIVSKSKGALYIDMTNSVLYVKKSVTGTEGWEAITVDTSNLANVDLSNLSNLGEMHFANVDLSNLSLTGQNRFADRNLSNITNDGKAVIQNTVGSLINNKVSKTGDTMTGGLQISTNTTTALNINNVSTAQRDITFNATNHRVATIRSEIDSSNQCQLLLGVNNTSDDAPNGLRLIRGTSGNAYIDQLPYIKTNIYEEKNSNCSFIGKNTGFNYTSTSTPSATVGIGQFICQDVNGKNVGGISIGHNTSNNVFNTMYARRSMGGTEKNAYLTIGVDSSGNPYATAPTTPALSSNNTSIATTEFIKKYIQCGTVNIAPNAETTVNFSTAFPNQYIALAFARVSESTQTIGVTYPMIRALYTGSFRVYNPSSGGVTYTWIAVWRG